ncbi:hypothetical protein ACVWZV_002727 [Bradyrhizobium sp. GM5.1]
MPFGIFLKSPNPNRFCSVVKGAVVGRDHLQRAGLQTGPKTILMRPVAERRRHHALRGMIPVLVLIFTGVQQQVLDQRLAIDALARRTCARDRLMRFAAARVHDIDRRPRHVGDHDGAVGGFALDLRRP